MTREPSSRRVLKTPFQLYLMERKNIDHSATVTLVTRTLNPVSDPDLTVKLVRLFY